jgi:hypothetical protein
MGTESEAFADALWAVSIFWGHSAESITYHLLLFRVYSWFEKLEYELGKTRRGAAEFETLNNQWSTLVQHLFALIILSFDTPEYWYHTLSLELKAPFKLFYHPRTIHISSAVQTSILICSWFTTRDYK